MQKVGTFICLILDSLMLFLFFFCVAENKNRTQEIRQLEETVKTVSANCEVLSAQNEKLERMIDQLVFMNGKWE